METGVGRGATAIDAVRCKMLWCSDMCVRFADRERIILPVVGGIGKNYVYLQRETDVIVRRRGRAVAEGVRWNDDGQ